MTTKMHVWTLRDYSIVTLGGYISYKIRRILTLYAGSTICFPLCRKDSYTEGSNKSHADYTILFYKCRMPWRMKTVYKLLWKIQLKFTCVYNFNMLCAKMRSLWRIWVRVLSWTQPFLKRTIAKKILLKWCISWVKSIFPLL